MAKALNKVMYKSLGDKIFGAVVIGISILVFIPYQRQSYPYWFFIMECFIGMITLMHWSLIVIKIMNRCKLF